MKKLILLFGFYIVSMSITSQESVKTLDYLYLENGEVIETRIIRVNNRKLYYTDPQNFQIVDISMDKVKSYEFNDEFFQTNPLGELEHSEVIPLEGYNSDEIYRAIKDWFLVNTGKYGGGIFLDDPEYFIILGTINTGDYIKQDFATFLSAIDNDPEFQTYSLFYDLNIRIKDNRFKIYISDFEIQDNNTYYTNALLRSYERRKTKDGIVTVSGFEIANLKKMITTQIDQIRDHCEYVRLYDTYHNQVVKQALLDDDW